MVGFFQVFFIEFSFLQPIRADGAANAKCWTLLGRLQSTLVGVALTKGVERLVGCRLFLQRLSE